MRDLFARYGLPLTDDQYRKFATYCDFLVTENEKYNLTAITETKDVFEKHFLDSLFGAELLSPKATVCDVGSGAGFPAVPLKIYRNDLTVTAVDSLQKRVRFLLALRNLLQVDFSAVHMRAEDFAHTAYRETFDVAVARAVAPLSSLLEYTAATVRVGGRILAYKTDESEVASAENAAKSLGVRHADSRFFRLPDGSQRCLLLYEKTGKTPPQYPRAGNKPRKSPL